MVQRARQVPHTPPRQAYGASALVRAAIDEGDVRADLDPALLTRLLFGMVNGVAESCRPNGAHRSSAVADTLVRLAFNGLRRPG